MKSTHVRKAAIAGLLAAVCLSLAGCGASGGATSQTGTLKGDAVEFTLDGLSKGARFFTYQTDAGKVGLVAVRDSGGTIRVALDTCQVCNGSPKAYFLEKDGALQCQNCGNTFAYDIVGDAGQGCEPTPLAQGSWSVEDGSLLVNESALAATAPLFATWAKQ